MPEHAIRLRAAWEGRFAGDPTQPVRRVDLPAPWPPGPTRPFELHRAFQKPRIDSGREAIFLVLSDVPGLLMVNLNDVTIHGPEHCETRTTLEIALPIDLPARNQLELRIDPALWPAPPAEGERHWGAVSLVIRSR